ncbi:hypothetical protein E2320_016127 [Naja naja]|nr:hypothetical protein E2320_016127 [Naja naja]
MLNAVVVSFLLAHEALQTSTWIISWLQHRHMMCPPIVGSRRGDAKGRRWRSFSKLFLRSGACAGQDQMYICLAVHEEAVLPTFSCKVLLKSLSLPYPQGHSGWSTSIAKLLSYSAGLAQSSREAIGRDQKGL